MGLTVQGATSTTGISGKDYKYKYPGGMDLRPGSRTHTKIINKVMESARASYSKMSERHPEWRLMDKMLTAYIKTSDYEKAVKKSDPNKPISIVVPYQYAIMETILAYKTKAFLTASPIFGYDGFDPQDIVGAKLLELVIDQQVRRHKSTLAIHTGLRNGLAYGIHASPVTWEQRYGRKPVQQPIMSAMGEQIGQQIVNEPTLLFEGNKIGAIDPYRYLPDPNYSPHLVQEGEFVGWIDDDSYLNLLADEAQGNLFNVKYLKSAGYGRQSMFFNNDARVRGGAQIKDTTGATQPIMLVNMYHTIVPKELGLRSDDPDNVDGDIPEKWLFVVANDCIVIQAMPLGLNHDMYPLAVNAPDYDGFSVSPISRLELSHGMQEVVNWMYNSHVHNVRKAMNDMLIVDPSMINMNDLQNPEPGKLLRLRRAAWGRGVKDSVMQLAVNDVTRQNIPDAMAIMDSMQRTTGSVDSMMGIMRSGGERRSATEFSGTQSSAISRLEHLAWVTGQMYMYDLAYIQASQTQQLMEKSTFVRAVGNWPQVLADEYGDVSGVPVSIDQLLVDFDVIPRDGSSVNMDMLGINFWDKQMDRVAQNPELNQVFEITRIFKHLARISGLRDASEFVRKGGSVNAEMIGQQAMLTELGKGNLIPTADMLTQGE